MGVFADHRHKLSLFSTTNGGLRACQLAAACAITAHFDRRKEACRVVLPTGAGKTALMMTTAFQLAAMRVLIITPSVAVRDQIARHFGSLDTLKAQGVLPEDVPAPRVHTQTGYVETAESWRDLEQYDVVVSTPNSVSPHIPQVADMPAGLFDLLIVDEAHHTAAPLYRRLLDDLKIVRTLLLTATPYRNDGKLVEGFPAYSFTMSEALTQGILTPLKFSAVTPPLGEADDQAVCKAISGQYLADKAAGKDYRIMVRTDSITRAKDLEKLYSEECPDVALKRLDHNSSLRTVEKAIEDLKAGTLDGLIAVDMFGEGFDFPDLKACALHIPHGSLATAVQFFGRFARSRGVAGDEALFFAVPSDELKGDIALLFEQDADWSELVANLADAAAQSVHDLHRSMESTRVAYQKRDAGTVQPHGIDIAHYMQVFIGETRDISATVLPSPDGFSVLRSWGNPDDNWVLAVYERQGPPPWLNGDALSELTYEYCFACLERIDDDSSYLLIASSHRSDAFFWRVAKALIGERLRRPPMHVLARLLRGITNVNCPSLGKRRQDARSSGESYNTSNGRSAQKTVSAADVARYRRGHVSVVGKRGGDVVTIGYSPGAKVWGPDHSNILQFRQWCKQNVALLLDPADVVTGTELDLLKASEALGPWPHPIVYIDWNSRAKLDGDQLWLGEDSATLYDTTMTLISEDAPNCRFEFELEVLGQTARYSFDVARGEWFAYEGVGEEPFQIGSKRNRLPLTAYWLELPPALRTLDGSIIEGDALYRHELLQDAALPANLGVRVDWAAKGIDIENELQAPHNASLHGFVESEFGHMPVLFKDHGSYEAADYISMQEQADGTVEVRFYHCKSSSEPNAGQRQEDLQEVLRQGFTSLRYVESPEVLAKHIAKRAAGTQTFISGDMAECRRLLDIAARIGWSRKVSLVQPGLTTNYSDPIKTFLLHSVDAFGREACTLELLLS